MEKELNYFITPNRSIQLEWTDIDKSVSEDTKQLQDEFYKKFTSHEYSSLLFLGFSDKNIQLSSSLTYLRSFASLFVLKLTQTPDLEIIRDKVKINIDEHELLDTLEKAPMMTGSEYLTQELLLDIWNGLNQNFSNLIKEYKGTVEEFIKQYTPNVHLAGRVFFHLVENKDGVNPFAFLATYSTDIDKQGQSKHVPLKFALTEYANSTEKLLELLATVYSAAQKSEILSELIETGELFHAISLSSKETFTFLKEIPLYEESGILCRIPNWWRNKSSNLGISVSMGDKKPSAFGMEAILDFNAYLLLGDTLLTEKEVKKLLAESEGLAFIKNKWIAVDHEKLKQTLEAYEKLKKYINKGDLTIQEALKIQLNPEKILELEAPDINIEVSKGKWLEETIEKLKNPNFIPNVSTPKGFKANLREYQQKGLNWLYFLHSLKFGACLADDMGLGKTVQILGFLNVLKSKKLKKANLLIIPASLISNWVNEINQFSPTIKYFIAHPSAHPPKTELKKDKKELDNLDLVITTYSLSQKFEWINSYSWAYIILDEAQAIKNPGTKQSKAIKKLQADNRIIMTGTPIENRISDLWSLFDFLNPGLLGNKTEFSGFVKKLNDNTEGYSRLRKVITPYILRRLKTDKSVISDLPDKIEMKTYSSLTKKQIVLYQNLVNDIKKAIEPSEGIARKGLILSSLIKFKQICNHPCQYLGSGGYDEKESGKFERLQEICEVIYEKREKVLIFSQFKEMTQPIHDFLATIFQRKGLILHGSVQVAKRKKIIEEFQSDDYIPFMVLSLKAGGIGLNLTQANHVIHFDRWWNPAVENQATDRAFRIGQNKNVIVHKFITKGTLEEKIDKMIEDKLKLSKEIIATTDEKWITEMDNKALIDLFTLTV
ncbi:MAG: DEAD/DEAH box helicase [Desulfobacterales bacterium]|nr:DEAD/DEAH box helicase [Desulfobacterales bacterium]